jgi:hypothetical protein
MNIVSVSETLTSTTLIDGDGGRGLPLTVTLTSTDGSRAIQLSSDNGLSYWNPVLWNTSTGSISAVIQYPYTNIKLTGAIGDVGTFTWDEDAIQVSAPQMPVTFTLLDAVTTNLTGNPQAIPKRPRRIQASISGTGTVSGTVEWYGSDTINPGVLIATSTLSGTTSDTTGGDISTLWTYIYAKTLDITGTNAAITAIVGV